jgi:UDP-N-acetylmuramoylalanine--D-glutamate ligase
VIDNSSWHSDWTGLRVAVLGLDPVAFSVVDTLAELGASVRVIADNPPEQYASLLPVIGATLVPSTTDEQLLIVTAATGENDPSVVWARANDVPIWGDVEFAWRVRDKVSAAEWICVTAERETDTVVDLAVHLLGSSGSRVAGVGHGNVPILDAVRTPEGFDVLVVELSEDDLRWAADSPVSPLASVCIDGAADAYGRVFANTRVACVYNKTVESTMHFVEEAEVVDGCRAIGIDLGTPGPSDLGLVGDIVVDRAFHEDRHRAALELTTHGELAAAGLGDATSVLGVLAASALVRAYGVAPEVVGAAIATFRDTRRA